LLIHNSLYSIIIPVFNEVQSVPKLINSIKKYSDHDIIIIDDGSTDGTYEILSRYNFIRVFRIEKNKGKGYAIKWGLKQVKNNLIIIFDGDTELDHSEIKKLMILDQNKDVRCVFASRYKKPYKLKNAWDIGNIIFTIIFNSIHNTEIEDALCCAKAFFLSDVNIESLRSNKFDIDVELASKLIKKNVKIKTVKISYNRRGKTDGKKLKMIDGFKILKRIISY